MNRVWIAAGLDPSGGAGVLADVAAVHAMGAWPQAVITALTVQNLHQALEVRSVELDLIQAQFSALRQEGRPRVCKLGMVGQAKTLEWLLQWLGDEQIPVVLDPVMQASAGHALMSGDALAALRRHARRIDLLMPNLDELQTLLEVKNLPGPDEAARQLHDMGFARVLIKGGHGTGPVREDALYEHGRCLARWSWPALPGSFRGTGCRLASATAAAYAMGKHWADAVAQALHWLHARMVRAPVAEGNHAIRLITVTDPDRSDDELEL